MNRLQKAWQALKTESRSDLYVSGLEPYDFLADIKKDRSVYGAWLRGPRAVRTYDAILQHPLVGAIDKTYVLTIASANAYIEASDSRIQKYAEEQIGLSTTKTNPVQYTELVDAAIGRGHRYGYSFVEKDLTVRDGLAVVKDLIAIPSKSVVDTEGKGSTLESILQQQDGKRVTIPKKKLLYFVYRKQEQNFWGESLFYSAYRAIYQLQELERLDMTDKERHAIGIAVASYTDMTSKPDSKDEGRIKNILSNMMAGKLASIFNPGKWSFDILGKERRVTTDLRASWERAAWFALVSTILNMLTIGSPMGSGAYSSSQTFDKLLHDTIGYSANLFTEEINRNLFAVLVPMNFGENAWARLVIDGIGAETEATDDVEDNADDVDDVSDNDEDETEEVENE